MVSIATSLSSTLRLNDGIEMPLFGLGTFLSSPGQGGDAERAVIHAINGGYKLIDTAEFYENEADVGRAIINTGVKREDMFVVTKLWTNGADRCNNIFNESLNKMGIGYIDLYLIHSPISGKIVETYKTMLELKEKGLVRSIGVSNFSVQHLEGLKAANLPTPAVNQIELHPWHQMKDVVEYCRDHGITVMGHSPLSKGKRINEPIIQKFANKYQKSTAQILIRWSIQHGFITIPKSSKLSRITENADVFDWSIDDDDIASLDSLPDWSCLGSWDPYSTPWKG